MSLLKSDITLQQALKLTQVCSGSITGLESQLKTKFVIFTINSSRMHCYNYNDMPRLRHALKLAMLLNRKL